MNGLSIYDLSKRIKKDVIEEEIKKRKTSQMSISFDEYWFSYDFSMMELSSKIHQNVIEISDLYSKLRDFEKRYSIRDLAINEIVISSNDRYFPTTNKNIFSSWIYDDGKGNSSLIDGYKSLLNGEIKGFKDVNDLKRIYDLLIRPRNQAYHLKNIKKYHYFRTEELTLGINSNLFLDEKGEEGEQEIIKKLNWYIDFLNTSPFDPYIKGGIFFFLFMKTMPFYNENFFICKFAISLFLQSYIKNNFLAVSTGKILDNYKDLLVSSFNETKSDANHGDLSHFVRMFLKIVLDGTNRLLQEFAIKNENKKELVTFYNAKESKSFAKIKEVLISSSSYSMYGSSVFEIQEITKISIPTINRFLEKYRKNLKKTRFVKRDYYRFG